MENKKKVYYGLDFLKFLMALLIIATHSQLLVEYNNIYHIATIIYSLAVPTFFSISTYFYAKKLLSTQTQHDAWKICKKDIFRLLLLGFFWLIIDLPMTWNTFISIANWKECIAGFFIMDPVRGLWFIKALIINKIILYLFRNHLKNLSIISFIVFILFSLGYTPLLNGFSHPYHPYFNFYFHTFFCCIGALFAKYQCLTSLRTDILAIFLIVIFLWHLYNYDYAVIAWRIICPFFFMNTFLHICCTPKETIKPLFLYMRKVSILFYFLHFNFLWLYNSILSLNDISIFSFSIIRYVVILVCCFFTSIVILKIEKIKFFSFLKYSH
ncbi:MAG TPA: acyltransferase [Bacteroidaceae bacterium]|nr:acyltransferase [Bacteroidaceae bacterium]